MDPTSPSFLVISHSHHLLPWAWRLRSEGANVKVVVVRKKYLSAWSGLLDKAVEVRKSRLSVEDLTKTPQWDGWLEQAKAGTLTILTDWQDLSDSLLEAGIPNLYAKRGVERIEEGPPPLYLGAWLGPTGVAMPHIYVPDYGAWIGGQGPLVEGAGTLLRLEKPGPEALLAPFAETLSSAGFKGLFRVGLMFNEAAKEFASVSVEAGWPFLHTHLFLAGVGLMPLLLANPQAMALPKRVAVGIPVTVPPWPHQDGQKGSGEMRVEVSPEARAHLFWHDMMTPDGGSFHTANLDGLVAVAEGCSDNVAVARRRAVAVATSLALPQRQVRTDAGAVVDGIWAGLEEMDWL